MCLLSDILDKFYFPQNILPKKVAGGKDSRRHRQGEEILLLGVTRTAEWFRARISSLAGDSWGLTSQQAVCLGLPIRHMRRIIRSASHRLRDSVASCLICRQPRPARCPSQGLDFSSPRALPDPFQPAASLTVDCFPAAGFLHLRAVDILA